MLCSPSRVLCEMNSVINLDRKIKNQRKIIFHHAMQRELSDPWEKKNGLQYFTYLGTYFSTAQTESLRTFIQQLYKVIVEMSPQRVDDLCYLVCLWSPY